MPYPTLYPQIRGHRYSFASIEFRANGSPFPIIGIKSINYSEELEPGMVRGTGSRKIGRTRGQHNAMGDMEMERLEWENLKLTLGAAGVGYGEFAFDIVVSYAETFAPVITDTLVGCRVTKAEFSNSEGSDSSTVKITLDVMEIFTAGVGSIINPARA